MSEAMTASKVADELLYGLSELEECQLNLVRSVIMPNGLPGFILEVLYSDAKKRFTVVVMAGELPWTGEAGG